jgi:hypothetical protein
MVAELYAKRIERFGAEAERLAARSRLLSNLRGLSFGVAVIAFLFAAFGKHAGPAATIGVLSAIAFIALILLHARVLDAEDTARRWAQVNRSARARCTGTWQKLPNDGAHLREAAHPYADDLDLFGPGSLFQRISTAHTHFGERALRDFLLRIAPGAEIRARQQAVRELASELDLRQKLEALALAVAEPAPPGVNRRERLAPATPDPEPLLRWAEGEPQLSRQPLLAWSAWLLPPLTLAGMLAKYLWDVPTALFTAPLALQLVITFRARNETARVFTAVSSTEGAFLRYGAMLEVIENLKLESSLIRQLRDRLRGSTDATRPSHAMKEFRKKVGWFDLRHNGLIHPFINLLLLWDVHCVLALERWQRRIGRYARSWFVALGEVEALASLAALAHDERDFAFPEIEEGAARFEALELGHPLIDAPQRIANDVALPAPGTALLVTGSNMSGKSTLLRAMGLAAVMAFAGGPVCAKRLSITPLAIRTSIRVSDSLMGGISHFYAELGKLKTVVDATAAGEPVLFLLDEILHGTNSRERQIGARWVLSQLLQCGALGAVSTHDMALCQLPDELMQRVSLVHFRESVQNGKMTFDYLLRPGPVTSGNALRLMQIIGLDVPLE